MVETDKMITCLEFNKMVNVQPETIKRYLQGSLILADDIKVGAKNRITYYFYPETVRQYAAQFGWKVITEENQKIIFYEFMMNMRMSYSYKPVFFKSLLEMCDKNGSARMADIVRYFENYYLERRVNDLFVEKNDSIFSSANFDSSDVKALILRYPYRRFAYMGLMEYSKLCDTIELDRRLWNSLTKSEKVELAEICNRKLQEYYQRFDKLEGQKSGS